MKKIGFATLVLALSSNLLHAEAKCPQLKPIDCEKKSPSHYYCQKTESGLKWTGIIPSIDKISTITFKKRKIDLPNKKVY